MASTRLCAAAVLLIIAASLETAALAQDLAEPIAIPEDAAPAPASAPAPAPPPPRAAAPMARTSDAPPVLSQNPRNRAADAAASGQGGMSYCGPAGAMSTGVAGAACAVSCASGQHQVQCPAGHSALCQCDEVPYAACRAQ